MQVYHGNEFLVALPEGLRDKTVHLFALTDEGPSEVSIVVARERPKAGETVELFVERLTSGLLSQLAAFRMLKRESCTIDNQPAVRLEYNWNSPQGKMAQRQVILYVKSTNQMLMLTGTCRGDKVTGKLQSMFDQFVSNFRLRN